MKPNKQGKGQNEYLQKSKHLPYAALIPYLNIVLYFATFKDLWAVRRFSGWLVSQFLLVLTSTRQRRQCGPAPIIVSTVARTRSLVFWGSLYTLKKKVFFLLCTTSRILITLFKITNYKRIKCTRFLFNSINQCPFRMARKTFPCTQTLQILKECFPKKGDNKICKINE